MSETLTYGRFTFQKADINRLDELPVAIGAVLLKDKFSDKCEVIVSTNVKLRIKAALSGKVNVAFKTVYKAPWENYLDFYYCMITDRKILRPSAAKWEFQLALGEHLIQKPIKFTREASYAIRAYIFPRTGEYVLHVRSMETGDSQQATVTALNKYRIARHAVSNKPLVEFMSKHGPLRAGAFEEKLLAENIESHQEAKEKAAAFARKLGTDKLLTHGVLPRSEWNHPAWLK